MRNYKILIIDDSVEICELLKLHLEKEHYSVRYCHTGNEALDLIEEYNPDLIMLDILLQDFQGSDICPTLRLMTNAPIIFLSCKTHDSDEMDSPDIGGDDYISKPFSPREMVARLKANLRRESLSPFIIQPDNEPIISFPSMIIDRNNHTVTIDGEVISLSVKEFELLSFLANSPNKVFSVQDLFRHVWSSDGIGDIRTVMVHVRNLRKKIEKNPAKPKIIINIRGAGYMLKAEEDKNRDNKTN